MNFPIKYILAALLLVYLSLDIYSQHNRVDSLLESHVENIPALNEKVSISVSNTSFLEFIRGVANSSGLNIDVSPDIDVRIVNNFNNVRVLDMIVFLADEYNLDVNVIGNIITISQIEKPELPRIFIAFNDETNRISLEVNNENVSTVSKTITRETGKNIITKIPAKDEIISCFIREMPFDDAIEKLALANSLQLEKSDDGFYILDKNVEVETVATVNTDNSRNRTSRTNVRDNSSRSNSSRNSGNYLLDVFVVENDSIIIEAVDAPVIELLKEIADKISINYFISPDVEETISGRISGSDLNEVFSYLFSGTEITHRLINNVYVIGEKKAMDYNEHAVIQLQNRSIDKLVEFFPTDLIENLEVIEFPELNSLFVSGPQYQINEFEGFVHSIDKVVPVVLIEVIIMYVNKTVAVSTGIKAGLGDAPVSTGGTVFPEVDMTIGADKINRILNDMGWINLGNVAPNFYVTLQAMESEGYLDIESTPKLSTLNGHEASMSIGNTEYYLEERTDIMGTQNPTQTTSQVYKSVNAELTLKIRPVMSGDEQITLEIEVSQSDFTERIAKTAPPGSVNRKFTSLIRVKNQEMILLGGLMEKRDSDSSSGTPILSRIPIIKWFFSSRKNETSDSKLSLLIRPTIIN
ncbi:MAG: type II and III secretion system protein [Bacteroidales bacterium]|nr:type II and III secretion system protein [Bacteroidales bacterium]MBN2817634.1 type II and III secretion system protein [Bacteroidales bacterium]